MGISWTMKMSTRTTRGDDGAWQRDQHHGQRIGLTHSLNDGHSTAPTSSENQAIRSLSSLALNRELHAYNEWNEPSIASHGLALAESRGLPGGFARPLPRRPGNTPGNRLPTVERSAGSATRGPNTYRYGDQQMPRHERHRHAA